MNPARKVLVVSHGFQSHYELGFVNGMAENGLPVLLLGSDTSLADKLHPDVEFANIRGSQDPRRSKWRKTVSMLAYHARLLAAAWRHRGSPVVIIGLLTPEWPVGVFEGAWLRLLSGNLALVVHNILPHNRHTPAARRVYGLIYRLPHTLLVHTEATRQDLQRQFGVSAQRICWVPHGLNDAVSLPSGSKADAKRALGLRGEDRTVLLFGLASAYKGTDLLLDALEQLPEVRLLMAGRCPTNEFGQGVRERVTRLVAAGRAVWFDRHVDDATAGRLFAAADCTALPYRQIDQSGVLLLSVTLGIPVLASKVGGLAEFVNPANGRFIPELTAEGVRAGLTSMLNDLGTFEVAAIRGTVAHLSWRSTLSSYVHTIINQGGREASDRGNHVGPVQ